MSTLDILKQIIDSEMEMPQGRVWAYNANMDLPKDDDLFIILFLKEQTPISNTVKYVSTEKGLEEHQSINIKEEITISLVSRSTQARDRAFEVHMALNSYLSRNLQAQNKMHISILGEIYDASFLEASSMLNRFDCRIRVFKSYAKIKEIDYFNKFSLDITEEMQGGNFLKNSFLYGKLENVFGYNTKDLPEGVVGLSTKDNKQECTVLDKESYINIFK